MHFLKVRGSEGACIWKGPPFKDGGGPSVEVENIRCNSSKFSDDGSVLMIMKEDSVISLYDCNSKFTEIRSFQVPNLVSAALSPCGTFVQTFQKSTTPQDKNVALWETKTGDAVHRHFQKNTSKATWPSIRFSSDEIVACRLATNEIQFFDPKDFSKGFVNRLRVPSIAAFELSALPGSHVAAFVPESKGSPASVQIYNCKKELQDQAVARRSFFRCSTVQLHWNRGSTGLLVVAQADVDKTNQSYYGETKLNYLTTDGSHEGLVSLLICIAGFGNLPGDMADWRPESPDKFPEIVDLIKTVDSLAIKDAKPQGQGSSAPRKTQPTPMKAPVKPAAYRPPHAKQAAAIQAELAERIQELLIPDSRWKLDKNSSTLFLLIGHNMLPVCSAAHCCSSQISFLGGPVFICPYQRDSDFKSILEDRVLLPSWKENHLQRISFRTQVAKSAHSVVKNNTQASLVTFAENNSYLEDAKCSFYNDWSSFGQATNEMRAIGSRTVHLEQYNLSAADGELDLTSLSSENIGRLIRPVESETTTLSSIVSVNANLESASSAVSGSSLSSATASFDDLLSRIQDSVGTSLNKGESTVTDSLDTINSSLTSITKSASQAVDSIWSRVLSNIDQSGDLASNRLSGLLNNSKEATTRLTGVSADALRKTIIAVEDSIVKGAYVVVYSYGSAKELLPPEIKDGVNVTEDQAIKILRPIGTAFQQVFTAIGGLERSFGVDPEDPIIPFILSLGSLAALWAFYWTWTYAGYAGDLSAEETFELLKSEKKAMLIDIRPEILRERDGVPDLRRAARSRYASVTLPEVDSSVRKLLRGGREVEDFLLAAVIRNLKSVQDRSEVIIMDADGSVSKGLARSLSKLGVKASFSFESNSHDIIICLLRQRAYLVKGGFKSWLKHDLRIKELKPETALTVLNEEAEAILEGVSAVQIIGYGVGLLGASYALLEWEKTLQLIAIVGLLQTIYRRLATYETSEDLRKDASLLLVPVSLGTRAFSWAAEKLETNGIGLPTSPSSSAVQNRVLQAAAKHESQPSSSEVVEGTQNPSPSSDVNENVDLSEA
ncbi:unnamed protein product [Linum tenue]|uniref:Rhodanese domain-containing protein n=1 Tax=Linum tenue TaxID=586396 RepID=A0AAV0IJR1_9ROSI|nr:unnamed protein product [Linum tenue]